MVKVAAYVRISQDRDKKSWGVETQVKKIRGLAKVRGWTIHDVYADNDTSASKPRGPKTDWARMLADADAKLFEMVVAVDVDRLLRSTKDLNTLIEHKLKIVTVDGEIDLSSADGEFRATMLAGIARFEARRKAERTVRSNERRRAEGMPILSGWTPFGYTKGGKVIEEQKEAVAKAFNDFLSDPPVSMLRIAADLNENEFTTARGTQWSSYAVRYLLSNPLYAGYIRYNKTGELFPVKKGGPFPPLVEEDTWRAAVAKLEDNVRRTTKRGNQPKYLLSGIALCGRCGAKMVAGQNDRKVPNYRCGKHFHLSRQREPVDVMAERALFTWLSKKNVWKLFERAEGGGVDKKALRSKRIALRSRLEELKSMMADPAVPLSTTKQAIETVQAEITQIDETLRPRSSPSPARVLVESVAEFEDVAERRAAIEAGWRKLDMDRRRMIVKELVSVTIEPIKPGHTRFDPSLIRIEHA